MSETWECLFDEAGFEEMKVLLLATTETVVNQSCCVVIYGLRVYKQTSNKKQ